MFLPKPREALYFWPWSYISELFLLRVSSHPKKSSDVSLLIGRKSTFGDRALAVRAPRLWYDLPQEIMAANPVSTFPSTLSCNFFMTCMTCYSDWTEEAQDRFPVSGMQTIMVSKASQTLYGNCQIWRESSEALWMQQWLSPTMTHYNRLNNKFSCPILIFVPDTPSPLD